MTFIHTHILNGTDLMHTRMVLHSWLFDFSLSDLSRDILWNRPCVYYNGVKNQRILLTGGTV